MSRLLLSTAFLALMIGTAEAQYVTRYESSDQPSVEVNLDVLNEAQERRHYEQTQVRSEPLPAAAPAPVVMQPPQQQAQPAPVAAEEPQRPKRRLLKPVLTARPAPEPEVAHEALAAPEPVVKRSVIMASEPEFDTVPDEAMQEMQAQADAMLSPEPAAKTVAAPIPSRKPEGVKKSWSAVDGTPAPYDLPLPPQQQAKAEPQPEPVAQPEPETKPEPQPQPEPEVAAAPAPEPQPEPVPEPVPAPVMAQADVPHVSTKPGAIISHRPRYSNEGGAAPQVSPPVVTQQAPVVSKPPVMSAPIPHRKPQEKPLAVAAPVEPVVAEPKNTAVDLTSPPPGVETHAPETVAGTKTETTPLVVPPSETAVQEPSIEEPAAAEPPVVPTIADLTLDFSGNSSDLTAESQKKLDNVIRQMGETIDSRLQVRGFANGEDGSTSSARRIALSRALSVRSYLMDKGVKPNRVDVMAKGSETDRTPKDRVDLIFAR